MTFIKESLACVRGRTYARAFRQRRPEETFLNVLLLII